MQIRLLLARIGGTTISLLRQGIALILLICLAIAALLYSAPPGRNRTLTIVGYVAMATVFPLNVVTGVLEHHLGKAWLFAVLGLLVVWGVIQEQRRLRRAKGRVRQLAAA